MAGNPYKRIDKYLRRTFKSLREGKKLNLKNFLDGVENEFKHSIFREKKPQAEENILIVRLDVIGDFILTSGFIREVRKNFPDAKITLIVSPLVYPVAELCPHVDEIFKFDGKTYGKNFFELLESIVDFCRDNLWRKNFSYAFSPQWGSDNLGGLLLAYLSGARERIGYGNFPHKNWVGTPPQSLPIIEMDNFLLTKNIDAPRELLSEVEKHFYVLPAAGFKLTDMSLELWYGDEDFSNAKKFLSSIPADRKKIVIGIGAGIKNRQYPVKKLVVALKEIAKKNFHFVIVGGKSEAEDAKFLEENLPEGAVLNLVEKTTLRETEAIIPQMDFYLGNFTGVLHMASAAKIPILGICHEAQDKENHLPGILSAYKRFPPYTKYFVVLRPAHALGDCANIDCYGGCCHEEAHCITQIEPKEIVEGFEQLEKMILN